MSAMNAQILGWLGYKNLGDESCFLAIKNMLPSWFQLNHLDDHRISENKSKPDVFIVGGGTILGMDFDVRMRCIHKMLSDGVPCVVWGSGIKNDPPAGITEISPHVVHCLNMMRFLGIRGPVSKKRLEDAGVKNVEVVGDPAFLLSLNPDIPSHDPRSKKIAFNIGDVSNSLFGMNEKDLIRKIKNLIVFLQHSGYEIHLFPMWHGYDEKYLDYVRNEKTVIHDWFSDPHELMRFFRECYCVVGEKLHACVLAAAAEVPFVSISYKEKGRDFAASLDLADYSVNTDEPDIDLKLLSCIDRIKKDLDRFRSVYTTYKTRYHESHVRMAKTVLEV